MLNYVREKADVKHTTEEEGKHSKCTQLKHCSMDWIMELQKLMINIGTYLNRH